MGRGHSGDDHFERTTRSASLLSEVTHILSGSFISRGMYCSRVGGIYQGGQVCLNLTTGIFHHRVKTAQTEPPSVMCSHAFPFSAGAMSGGLS